jgi:hypothetical protein
VIPADGRRASDDIERVQLNIHGGTSGKPSGIVTIPPTSSRDSRFRQPVRR